MTDPKAPTEEVLRLLLKNGPNFYSMIEEKIKKWNLPYRIEVDANEPDESKRGILKPTLTAGEMNLSGFITCNPAMIDLKTRALKMSLCEYPVLITGETGTGKEIMARAMIGNREGPIKSLNCAGFPDELIESELFGHTKGSFTGATSEKIGLMKAADNGVCFLDEIGELKMPVQAKLLRALQSMKIRKVGSNIEEDITCKFVCATNRNLKSMVNEGSFRKDLYARISTLEIDIPPLRERLDDVEVIVTSIKGGKEFLDKYGLAYVRQLDLSLNVRSLQQYIIRYNVLGNL